MNAVVVESTLTCPHCGIAARETMPNDACLYIYECSGCGAMLRLKPSDCCVICSYGSVACPRFRKVPSAVAADDARKRMPLVVYPFRYRDARTGKWVKARYMAERTEIAAQYAEWKVTGPGEERRPIDSIQVGGRASSRRWVTRRRLATS